MATHLDDGGYIFKTPAGLTALQDSQARFHDTKRLERIALSWSFYYGEHWTFRREDDELLVTVNYMRKFVDKKAQFLIGADFTLNVPPSLESVTLPKLSSVWRDNGRQHLNYELAQEGGVTGDVFVLITVAEADPQTLRFDPYTKRRIVIQRLSSHQCFPVWDHTKPMGRYGRPMVAFTNIRWIRRWNAAKKEDEEVRYVLTVTNDYIITKTGEDPPVRVKNVLGEIPIVHIQNMPSAGTLFGIDDLADLIPLNKDYNEKATDISDSINYNSAPVIAVIGSKTKNLERTPRSVWSIPNKDAKIEIIRLEGELEAAVSYLERTKDSMHDLSGVPASAFGRAEHLSGASGVALAMTLQPLLDERSRKRSTYEPGFERINYFILRFAEIYHGLRLPKGLCAKCGGKIAIFYIPNPEAEDPNDEDDVIAVRRCYQVDPDTLDFLNPEENPLPVIPLVKDPPVEVDGRKLENVPETIESVYGEQESEIPETFDLPLVEQEDVDDEGNVIPGTRRLIQKERKAITAIPITCNSHEFLNPFTTEVLFNDTFPKDKKEQMDLFGMMLNLKLVTRAYVMQQLGIENIEEMIEAIDREREEDFNRQVQLNLALNGTDPEGEEEEAKDLSKPENRGGQKRSRGRPKKPQEKPPTGVIVKPVG